MGIVSSPAVMWFRRDLRCEDHLALSAAASHGAVVGLYILDPAFAGAMGTARGLALRTILAELDARLGGALVIRVGDPGEVLADVTGSVGARDVYVTREYTPYGRRRDAAVIERLAATGVQVHGVGTNYLVAPGTVRKGSGDPYSVFTPFSKVWRTLATDAPVETPASIDWVALRSDGLPGSPMPVLRFPETDPGVWMPVTAAATPGRWDAFCEQPLGRYHLERDLPARDGTSRLSVALRWGLVHPRRLMADLAEIAARSSDPEVLEAVRVFSSELAWREFYADVLFHQPRTAWENLNRSMDPMAVDTDAAARARFAAWAEGHTGFGIVDAGMRQLRAVGWMHNRVRMIVASFLVKDLHLPWQWGARHFMNHLLDGDLASNQHGWQWAAGTGTDAAPYFRVFNPTAQQQRYDADGEYCAQWIQEWGTSAYPAPMVDHAAERLEALARYRAIRA